MKFNIVFGSKPEEKEAIKANFAWTRRKLAIRYLYAEDGYKQNLKKARTIIESCLKELKKESTETKSLSNTDDFDIFGGIIQDATKISELGPEDGAVSLDGEIIFMEDKVLKSVMGTIASIALSVELLDDSKPVIGLSRLHNDIKISGRTTRDMVAKGVNLGKALQDSSNNFGGTGGGHDIAAGAMIPYDSKDNFLHLVDEMVEYQLNND